MQLVDVFAIHCPIFLNQTELLTKLVRHISFAGFANKGSRVQTSSLYDLDCGSLNLTCSLRTSFNCVVDILSSHHFQTPNPIRILVNGIGE